MAFCRGLSLGSFLSIGCALLSMNCVDGKPSGFRLKGGEALPPVQNTNGEWVIQSGQKAFIDWEHVSIDMQEVIRFQQANERSGVLNRVVGTAPSELLGQLFSNGAVYLVNPNGILIGSEAQIETELIEHRNNLAVFRARVTIPSGASATGLGRGGTCDEVGCVAWGERVAIGGVAAALGFGT